MKKIFTIAILVLVCGAASAQKDKGERFSPKAGDWSLGVSINPVAAGGFKYQPKASEFVGDYLLTAGKNPQQMFMLSQPLASIRLKYFLSDKWAFKASLGFSGSAINYKEYVKDDWALANDPTSEALVVDEVKGKLNGGGLALGFESNLGKGPVKFIFGLGLIYSFGGGVIDFKYGNEFASFNGFKPTTIGMADMTGSAGENLNDFTDPKQGIDWARPAERNNIGICQQLGLTLNAGIEWFVVDRISVGLTADFIPVAINFQPQTWGLYEGYSKNSEKVEKYARLVSPGSNAITYGLNNLGVNISVNYYF